MKDDSLVSQICTSVEANSIKKIYKDGDCDTLILDSLAERLVNSKNLVSSLSLNQLILICNLNKQIIDDSEPITVATFIMYVLKKVPPFPLLNTHGGLDFASRTLICMGFFEPAMTFREHHFGFPSKEWYKRVAQIKMQQNNLDYLAKNFTVWQRFLSEYFVN